MRRPTFFFGSRAPKNRRYLYNSKPKEPASCSAIVSSDRSISSLGKKTAWYVLVILALSTPRSSIISRFVFSETVTIWSAVAVIFFNRRKIKRLLSSVVNGSRRGTRSCIVYTLQADFDRSGSWYVQ